MKLLIAGSRGYNDWLGFKSRVDGIIKNVDKKGLIIVEGGDTGPDLMAKRYAVENEIEYKEVLADWDRWGKSAGYKRNRTMAGMVTHAIIFWDGVSNGTKDMIELCNQFNIQLRKVMVNKK